MMLRTLRTPLVPAVLLAVLVALPVPALAGGARVASATLRSTPFATTVYGPGVVSGQARLVDDAGSGTTSVVVRVEGLRPGTTHIGCWWWVAIHEGPENATPQTPAIAIGALRFVEPGS